ncbi:MAG: DUF4838 domain-containing protein, partial [Clostridia bacterium]|nr:DUF4838 domain-containing protein [Clostridia bacterium]
TESVFSDVPDGIWYAAPAAWAADKGITGGTGDGVFSPDALITRQEFVTMLRKYAEFAGYDHSTAMTGLSGFSDADEAADWAKESLCWAYEKGIVSGIADGDSLLLSPKGTATRAQAATMLVKLLYLAPVRTINGNDLADYRIVYNKDAHGGSYDTSDSAEKLAGYIKSSLGIELPVVSDEEEPTDLEILVGKTNRDGADEIEEELAALGDDQKFLCKVKGDKLFIVGVDTDSHDGDHDHKVYNVDGTRNAVFYFADEVLGVRIYSDSDSEKYFVNGKGIYEYEPDPVISLDDGWTYVDGPWCRKRTFYMSGGILGTGEYRSDITYSMTGWITDNSSDDDSIIHASTPCLSDENNLNAVLATVRKALDKKPRASKIGMGINDSRTYCTCEKCTEAYRKYGTRGAALMLFINRVAEMLENEYPGVMIQTGAYTYTVKPPIGLTMRDNVIIEFYTIDSCCGHAYDDPTCSVNAALMNYALDWRKICKEMVFWDHCCNFVYSMCPIPDWHNIRGNMRFFADLGVREVLMNSLLDSGYRYSDFCYLRGYALSMVYRDPFMSDEEYWYRMDKAIAAYYGPGWKNIREYLDIISTLGSSKCHRFQSPPGGMYDFTEVRSYADRIDQLWEDAKEAANGDEILLYRITLAQHSWIFLRQSALYQIEYLDGTPAQRAKYEAINQELYDFIVANNISWTEGTLNTLTHFSVDTPPWKW